MAQRHNGSLGTRKRHNFLQTYSAGHRAVLPFKRTFSTQSLKQRLRSSCISPLCKWMINSKLVEDCSILDQSITFAKG